MRNAFVVLVSLYIGLASGFIVPPGVTEKLSDSSILSMTKTNIDNKNTSQLEKTGKVIDELLYENADEKENNLKERSFIYINQKYKSKLKNQGFGLNVHNWSPRVNEDRAFLISKDSARLEDLPYKFAAENIENSKRVVMTNYKIKVTDIPDYAPLVLNTQSLMNMNRDRNRPKYEFNENLQDSRTSYKQREYLELLKPPLIRPAEDEIKFRKNYNNNVDDLLKLKDEAYRYEPYTFPEVEISSNSQFNQKQSNRFGFLKYPSQQNYGTHNKSYNNVPKYSDVSGHKPIESNFEIKNIGYSQHKVTNENMNRDDCNYSNCITKSIGQEVNNHKNTGTLPKCSCANRLNFISKDQSVTIDRSQREKLKDSSKPPLLLPSEGDDYDEMFNEEDDVVNAVNKLSDTLRS